MILHLYFISLVLISYVRADTVTVGLSMDAIAAGITIEKGDAPRNALLTWTADKYYEEINFILVPCYGAVSWWLDFNRMPNSTNFVCGANFAVLAPVGKCSQAAIAKNTVVNIVVQGLDQYQYNPYFSAKFDAILWSSTTALDEIIPEPGGGGVVKAAGSPELYSISWIGTGVENDTYTVYKFYGAISVEETGFINYTACGAAEFMKNLATVSAENDVGSYKEENLPSSSVSFTIVANRVDGYATAYSPISVGGGNIITVPIIFIVLCILGALLQ